MKIGIMSMQRIVNYGSFLQAYGLKKTIENLGHDVQFVDFKVESSISCSPIKQNNLTKLINYFNILSPKYRKWRKKQIKLNQTFSEFTKEYDNWLKLLDVSNELNLTPVIDTLIIGSDEVFNCTQNENKVGYSLELFGKNNNANKLISYAASFGNTTLDKLEFYKIKSEIGNLLNNFNALSVRDENSCNIIKELINKVPYKHIDPVLLYEFPEVNKLSVNRNNYIIVYAYADRISELEAEYIRNFARKHNKSIITLGYYQPFCDEWILATPFEVLAYIKNADYIITDTFHGTVFSIKYKKQFATIIRESNKQKISDLLNTFELNDHKIENLSNLNEVLNNNIDENKIKNIIKNNQQASIEYLKNNL